MLCAPVFSLTSGSSALLGRPHCGLSIWLSLLAIFNTLFGVYANLFHEKKDKTREYSKSAIFVWYQNSRRLLGAHSINIEWTSRTKTRSNQVLMANKPKYYFRKKGVLKEESRNLSCARRRARQTTSGNRRLIDASRRAIGHPKVSSDARRMRYRVVRIEHRTTPITY